MKLSAPPPPPPEPNPPGEGEQPATPAADAPPAPPSESPTPPAAPKLVTWPAWFAGADFLLAVMALVLAFMVASFVARNSDVWLHLAAGKRLLAGEYTPGSDPFSFSGADRTWVNHSILFDVAAYLIYGNSGNGGTLVVLKALFAAAAFGLVIGIRRPGFPLWPWAAVGAVAVVAAAPYLQLRPVVGSLFLLAVTLFLLFRVRHVPNSWRFPGAFGVVCWVWANVDEWFFLGPLTVALVLVGELIQRRLSGPVRPNLDQPGSTTAPQAEEPLGALPDVPTLAKALGIGLLACMLNPHHIGVWQLPFELVGTKDVAADARFRAILATPREHLYTSNEGLGNNQNGLAFAVLFVAGGAMLGLAVGRLRIAHVALWVGFALLSLLSVYAIPFLALVAVPIIASQLNSRSSDVTLGTWNEQKTRFLLMGAAGGRVISIVAVAVACVLAWPGWLHPPVGNPAQARWVGWGIETEPALVKGAEQLQAWRESGRLPADAHGVSTAWDFANYCAWFAPLEKVYVNGRFNHHRPEWADYGDVRVGMRLIRSDTPPDSKLLPEVLRRIGAEYVVLSSAHFGDAAMEATVSQWVDTDRWCTWYINGRVSISGWRPAPGAEKPTFDSLRLEPVALAFGPGVERLPPGSAQPVRPRGGWEEEFIQPSNFPPPAADEAMIWVTYDKVLEALRRPREEAVQWAGLLLLVADRVVGVPGTATRFVPPIPRDDRLHAAAFLAVRAARRAIAADPNHPDGYLALFESLANLKLPLSDVDRAIGQVTALRQCLERMPAPENYQPGIYKASPTGISRQLAFAYAGLRPEFRNVIPGIPVNERGYGVITEFRGTGTVITDGKQLTRVRAGGVPPAALPEFARRPQYLLPIDVIRDVLDKALKYAEVELTDPSMLEKEVGVLKAMLKHFNTEYSQMNIEYQRKRVGRKLDEQIRFALELNLSGEALHLLTTEPLSELGKDELDFLLCRVALELALGRLEDAAADLEILTSDPGVQKRMSLDQLAAFRGLLYQKSLLEGNYAEAGRLMEEMNGSMLREDPMIAEREKFDPKPLVENKHAVLGWHVAGLSALLAPTPCDLAVRSFAPEAVLRGYQTQVSPTETRLYPGFVALQNGLAQFRDMRAGFFLRRGMLFLFEGDIAEAERRFLQTRLEPVESWGLPPYRHGGAEAYLTMIAEARRLSQGK